MDLHKTLLNLSAEIQALRVDESQLDKMLRSDRNKRNSLLSAVQSAKELHDSRLSAYTRMLKEYNQSLNDTNAHKGLNRYFIEVDKASVLSSELLYRQAEAEYDKAQTRARVGIQMKCMETTARHNVQRQLNAIKADISERTDLVGRIARAIDAQEIPNTIENMKQKAAIKANKEQRIANKKQAKYLKNLNKRLEKQAISVLAADMLYGTHYNRV